MGALHGPPERAIVQKGLDRPEHLLVEVDGPTAAELVALSTELETIEAEGRERARLQGLARILEAIDRRADAL
jgi:hypothetical protein